MFVWLGRRRGRGEDWLWSYELIVLFMSTVVDRGYDQWEFLLNP